MREVEAEQGARVRSDLIAAPTSSFLRRAAPPCTAATTTTTRTAAASAAHGDTTAGTRGAESSGGEAFRVVKRGGRGKALGEPERQSDAGVLLKATRRRSRAQLKVPLLPVEGFEEAL